MYLQNGESGESGGQQGSAASVDAASDEVHQVHRHRIQKGHDHPPDEGKTLYVSRPGQGADQFRRGPEPPGQGSQSVKRVGGDGQHVEREVTVGVRAPMLAGRVPQRVER